MGAGASGGADIDGRAFDAGPVGVGLADPQGTAAGLAQAQEAQEAFDALGPFGSVQERQAFERELFDPTTMTAQLDITNPKSFLDPSNYDPRNYEYEFDWGIIDPLVSAGLRGATVKAAKEFGFGYAPALGATTVLGGVLGGKAIMDGIADKAGFTNVTEGLNLPGKGAGPFGEDTGGGGGGYGGSGSTEGGGYGQQSIFGGVNVDQIGMNRALNNNRAVIDALQEGSQSANFNTNAISQAGGDPRLAEARRIAEQRAAESMLARFQPQGNTSGPITVTIPSTEEGEPDIDVTIPVDDTVDDTVVTKKPKKPRNPNRDRPSRKPSKAKTIVKSLSKPKSFKRLPKFAQKELRRGIVPTSGSDYVQDMVRAFLAPNLGKCVSGWEGQTKIARLKFSE